MRSLPNDTGDVTATRLGRSLPHNPERRPERPPVRRCILSGVHGDRAIMTRLALGPDNVILPDIHARAPGRGAWIGVSREVLQTAMDKGKLKSALARAFKMPVGYTDDLCDRIENALARATLDRLGLEARASMIELGSEKIMSAMRGGKVSLLLHSSDAAEDGSRKLESVWGYYGHTLPVDRAALSTALGRGNAVHVAFTNKSASRRVSSLLGRWLYFMGKQSVLAPCETAQKGPSGPGVLDNDLAEI
jgi:uncharacterized protein